MASVAGQQKHWSSPLAETALQRVVSAAPNQAGRARLIAAAAPHSGAFLQAVLMTSVCTRLDNTSIRIAIALRLGASVCAPHRCICVAVVDSSGIHGLSCRKSSGRFARHNTVNGLIKATLSSAEIPSRLEPGGLVRDDG
jgi:hypothetical protein